METIEMVEKQEIEFVESPPYADRGFSEGVLPTSGKASLQEKTVLMRNLINTGALPVRDHCVKLGVGN